MANMVQWNAFEQAESGRGRSATLGSAAQSVYFVANGSAKGVSILTHSQKAQGPR